MLSHAYILQHIVFTGTLSELEPSKKRFPVRVVFIVLLVCLVLAAVGLAALMLWHVYRKDKHPVQWDSSSSDRLTSCNSAVNLISHGSSPMPVYKGYLDSSAKPFLGKYPCSKYFFWTKFFAFSYLFFSSTPYYTTTEVLGPMNDFLYL